MSNDLKAKYGELESARSVSDKNCAEQLEKFYPNLICTQNLGHMTITSERLHKQSVVLKQICKLFPQRRVNVDAESKDEPSGQYDQICNARLPRGLDPYSVPFEELGASLGYMVQLLNLVAQNLAIPTLHNSGFAGSCSRIWERDSYWDARPSSRSQEYPLFIPRQNYCSTSVENSWTDRSSSNFGVASIESERRPRLDSPGSFNYSSASPHTVETQGIAERDFSAQEKRVVYNSLLYNTLCVEVPSESSTFEAFAKLLATLSSSKEVCSIFNLRMARSSGGPMWVQGVHPTPHVLASVQFSSRMQIQQMNKSVCNVNSAISSSSLLDSAHSPSISVKLCDNDLPSSAASYLYATEIFDNGKSESLIDGWDLVELPKFPPPPSQANDIEHWTQAMFIDATKKK